MPVYKRKYKSGDVVWSYLFSGPGATREDRRQCTASGFNSKKEAQDAEAARRVEEQQKFDLAKAGAVVTVSAELPKTLSMLLDEFFKQHAEESLAPKTIERYRECAAYLAPELAAMPLADITPLHLNREWKRLLNSGGHSRRTKAPRPMTAKTVRNIAGVVSSAFGRAVKWGLLPVNPCTASEPPSRLLKKGISMPESTQCLAPSNVESTVCGCW